MPDLPKVSQDFTADVSDYVAKMQLMIDETERFMDEVDAAIVKVGEFKAALNSLPDMKVVTIVTKYVTEGKPEDIKAATETLTEHVNVVEDVNDNLGDLNSKLAAATAANKAFSESAGDTVDRLIAEAKAAEPAGMAMAAAAAGAAALAKDSNDAAKSTDTVAGAFGKSVAGFTAFGIGWQGLHWILMGTTEVLATLIPATIALGAGMAAGAEGAQWIANKLQGVYTASEATSQMLGKTAGNALGLQSTLQKAQTAADPGVYELLGAALNGAKTQFFNFGAEGVSVIHMLDAFAAKIDVELAGCVGKQLHQMLGTGHIGPAGVGCGAREYRAHDLEPRVGDAGSGGSAHPSPVCFYGVPERAVGDFPGAGHVRDGAGGDLAVGRQGRRNSGCPGQHPRGCSSARSGMSPRPLALMGDLSKFGRSAGGGCWGLQTGAEAVCGGAGERRRESWRDRGAG